MSMKLKKRLVNSTPTVAIFGEVSGKNSLELSNELRQVSQSDSTRVVINLSDAVTLDSSAMGVILYWWKNLKQQSRQLVLCNPHDAILELLVTTNLDKLISVIPSADQL